MFVFLAIIDLHVLLACFNGTTVLYKYLTITLYLSLAIISCVIDYCIEARYL
jgi:hypothetical protein